MQWIRASLHSVAFMVLWSILASTATAGGQQTTDDFAGMHAAALRLGQQYGAERVLLVFDIDNTLLAMNQDLGSDPWFDWQRDLQKTNPNSKRLVAREFDDLLAAQGLLFTLSPMHPPQADAPDLVRSLQKRGFPTLALTSRSDAFRAAAERELKRNGYAFDAHSLPLRVPKGKTFAPYNLSNLAAVGLSADDEQRYDLVEPRPVSYNAGVFMAAGQHKGVMLLTILARAKHKYSAVVFIDDHDRHTKRVHDVLSRHGVDVTTFRYSHEDAWVERFRKSDKREVTSKWRRLQKTLDAVLD